MFIEELTLPVSIYPDIRIQPDHLTAPHGLLLSSYDIPQPTLFPECFSELRVGDLEAVINTDSFANLGLSRGCGERDGLLKECQVCIAERGGEQLGDSDYLRAEHSSQLQVKGRN